MYSITKNTTTAGQAGIVCGSNRISGRKQKLAGIREEVLSDILYWNPFHLWDGGCQTIATISGLSNTEQKLDMRRSTQVGMGKFLARTNALYWGAKVGVNRNIEQYSNDPDERRSWEGYFGTELNLYNLGDIDLLFLIMAYPSITEGGRWRSDLKFIVKYDLPLDFYIKLGFTLNYDNQPTDNASDLDYLLQTGIGWEW